MTKNRLKKALIIWLSQLYNQEFFGSLTEFFRGENNMLNFLYVNSHIEVNPSLISENLHISRARTTATLRALRKKGYVSMEISENDRRRISVKITAEGNNLIKEKKSDVDEYFDVLVEGLGEEDTLELIRLIKAASNILQKHTEKNN